MERLGGEAGAADHEQACEKEETKRLHGAKRWGHEDVVKCEGRRREGVKAGGRSGLRFTPRFTPRRRERSSERAVDLTTSLPCVPDDRQNGPSGLSREL
jgi:hypothetical protein